MRIGLASFQNPDRSAAAGRFGAGGLWVSLVLPVIVVAGIAAWLMLPEPSDAGDEIASPASTVAVAQNASTEARSGQAAVNQATANDVPPPAVASVPAAPAEDEPATVGLAIAPPAAPEATPAAPGAGKSPLDGLRIASQSWRRGGLGSKALVTLTLRNGNDFAVRDIEVACAFARRDGSRLTERKRLIADTIAMKSRKTYSRMLIGFVNINANKAKCSVVTASRL